MYNDKREETYYIVLYDSKEFDIKNVSYHNKQSTNRIYRKKEKKVKITELLS